jgi:carbohydrate-binding DOMON domain-containing protein
VANSGYASPLSTDSSPTLVTADLFSNQVIGGDIVSITLFHRQPGQGVVNSVHPLCIGFTRVDVPADSTTTSTTTTTTTTTQAPQSQAADTTTTTTTTTTTAAPAAVAAPTLPPELALTGAGDLSMSLGLMGGALTVAGLAALAAARRREDDDLA